MLTRGLKGAVAGPVSSGRSAGAGRGRVTGEQKIQRMDSAVSQFSISTYCSLRRSWVSAKREQFIGYRLFSWFCAN